MTTLTDAEIEALFSRPREFDVARDAEVLEGVVEQILTAREADLREQIAAEIEAGAALTPLTTQERWQNSGMKAAARIARGGAS